MKDKRVVLLSSEENIVKNVHIVPEQEDDEPVF